MDNLHPRDGLLQLEDLEVAVHEVPLVAAVAGVRPHLLRDERGEPAQHLLVLPLRRGTCVPRGGGGGGGGLHGAGEEEADAGGGEGG